MSKKNHVASDIKPQGSDEPQLAVILFFNVLFLIALWLILLVPLNGVFVACWKNFSPCPPSKFQTLGVAFILVGVLHLIWRFLGEKLVNLMQAAGSPAIGRLLLTVGLLQPHELDNRVLWALFVVVLVVALALVGLSPLSGVPILLSNFTVQRTISSQTETINPGDTLLVVPGEIIHITANVSGPTGFECEWCTNAGTTLRTDGCSLTYSAPRNANLSNVAVQVSSPCWTDPAEFAGFHIEVAQTTP